MTTTPLQRRDELLALVREALIKAECQLDTYRPLNRHLPVVSICCGVMVTLFALCGIAIGRGYIVRQFMDWTILCECIVFFAVVGMAAVVIHQALRVSEKADVYEECLAGLRELDAGLADPRIETLPAVEAYQNIQMKMANVSRTPGFSSILSGPMPDKLMRWLLVGGLLCGFVALGFEARELPELLRAHVKDPYKRLAIPIIACLVMLDSLVKWPSRIKWIANLVVFLATMFVLWRFF